MRGKDSKKILIKLMRLILVLLVFTGCFVGKNVWKAKAAVTEVKAPTASVRAGKLVVDGPVSIELKCATKNAVIYYSTDGENFQKYSKPIVIEKNTTITTYAKKKKVKSAQKVFKYKLQPMVSVTPNEGSYYGSRTVKLETPLKKVKMYYTTNGSKPTVNSQKYTDKGIVVDKNTTLRVLVKKSGWTKIYLDLSFEIFYDESGASFAANVDDIEDYTQKILYNTLEENEKAVYKAIYDGYMNFDEKTEDLSKYEVQSDFAMDINAYVLSENPQIFWADSHYMVTPDEKDNAKIIKLFYTDSKATVKNRKNDLEEAAQELIDNGKDRNDGLFDFVLYLHDTICEKTEYSLGGSQIDENAGADDVILDRHGSCAGYAKAFSYLCQMSGIPCICIYGEAYSDGKNEEHCWNKVFLGGEWYNVDVLWDDMGDISHVYCCLTDTRIEKDHYEYDPFALWALAAESNKFSYAAQMGFTEYDNVEDAYWGLIEESARQIKKNDKCEVKISYICEDTSFSEEINSRLNRKVGDGSSGLWEDLQTVDREAYNVAYMRGCQSRWRWTNNSFTMTLELQ